MNMARCARFRSVLCAMLMLPAATAGLDAPAVRAAAPAAPIELTVYAAASLKDALNALAPVCGKSAGASLLFNFGASNDLARQIQAANKADVFFSADESWMDQVAAAGLVDASSRRSLLSNRLVVVTPADSSLAVGAAADLAGPNVKRLSLANPDAVPAGKYAKAWLERAGVWDEVKDKVVPAPDARAALAAVESGAVEAGVVYRTDAGIAKRAKVVFTVPESEGLRISYPVAALEDRPSLAASRKVVDCFSGPEGRAVFERFGFVVLVAR
ncbi:MAG TPA: molybdate ABC transporter substrate-binding protein [Candidatus Polarisedimenticolia bacterium]|nr:molybdate ABC transporter substrate-binding protein [Candidatus Polarisedimenticolia bacterium]